MEFGIKIQDGGDAQRSVGVGNATTPLHVVVAAPSSPSLTNVLFLT